MTPLKPRACPLPASVSYLSSVLAASTTQKGSFTKGGL